jgi:hypothetical protein
MQIKDIIRGLAPPMAWQAGKKLLGRAKAREAWRDVCYQRVKTGHNARPLHVGRFADIFERHHTLDPWNPGNVLRYRIYMLCSIAALCRNVPGDFIACGVSWGVAERCIFDFADLSALSKTFHLIDPFMRIDSAADPTVVEQYNGDPEFVRRQYPPDAPIRILRDAIPACLPLAGVTAFSFVHLGTGDHPSEAQSLPYFFSQLSQGGWIVIDDCAINDGYFDEYDPVLQRLGIEPMWLPSGQAVIHKL